jgi:glycosyltransferase involved in cell wall biosynthesis
MAEARPRISIVTSSFNQAQFIARTIDSVRHQDYPNVEHIVVDGMSTDGTEDILAGYSHLKVIREPDRGQADAINKGFRAATGDIFAFLNSDDTLEPGALMAVASEIGAGHAIVMGRCRFIDEDDRFTGVEHPSGFESHRRMLEIWKGYCVPQPSVFWARPVWDACGPLAADEALVLDYDLFCRFSQRYRFHYIDRVLANYRLHLHSKTSSVTDAERLERAIAVSRRYWGPPFSLQYWQLAASYRAFRFNRRVRAAGWMRAGRDRARDGGRLAGWSRMVAGAVLAPDVIAGVRWPGLRSVVNRQSGSSPTPWGPVEPQTAAYLHGTALYDDGWAGPTMVKDLDAPDPSSKLTLSGRTMARRLSVPLRLEAFVDGRSLGEIPVAGDDFAVSWPAPGVAPGRHEVRIVANTFMVPHDRFGNQDYRPLSYSLSHLELDAGGSESRHA